MKRKIDIIVCGVLVPDPLQSLVPEIKENRFSLKNENLLPMILDPMSAKALYKAKELIGSFDNESKIYLVCSGKKNKVQQMLMKEAQKLEFELVLIDNDYINGFNDSLETAKALANAIRNIPEIDTSNLLILGGYTSASKDSGVTMPLLAGYLGINEVFLGADFIEVNQDSGFIIKERNETNGYLVSTTSELPLVVSIATGEIAEPCNNPQVGMANMRKMMPILQKSVKLDDLHSNIVYEAVDLPKKNRSTLVVKDKSPEEIAIEIVNWIKNK